MPDITKEKILSPHREPYHVRVGVKIPSLPDDFDLDTNLLVIRASRLAVNYDQMIHDVTADDIEQIDLEITGDYTTTDYNKSFWLRQDNIDAYTWTYLVIDVTDSNATVYTLEGTYDRAISKTITDDHIDSYDAIDPRAMFKIVQPATGATWVAA